MSRGTVALALFDQSLDWLVKNVRYFDVRKSDLDPRGAFKAFGELVLLICYLLRSGNADRRSALLVEFCKARIPELDLQAHLAYYPETLTGIAYIDRFCRLVGIPMPLSPQLVQDLFATRLPWAQGFEPFRRLDILYSSMLFGHDVSAQQVRSALVETALLRGGPAHLLSHPSMYAVTHCIFYITDFGFASPRRYLSAPEMNEVAAAVRWGTCVSMRDRYLDLMAEYVACWRLLRMEESPLFEDACADLARCQDDDGSMPPFDVKGAQSKPPFERWNERHHSTIVTAVAARAMQREALP